LLVIARGAQQVLENDGMAHSISWRASLERKGLGVGLQYYGSRSNVVQLYRYTMPTAFKCVCFLRSSTILLFNCIFWNI